MRRNLILAVLVLLSLPAFAQDCSTCANLARIAAQLQQQADQAAQGAANLPQLNAELAQLESERLDALHQADADLEHARLWGVNASMAAANAKRSGNPMDAETAQDDLKQQNAAMNDFNANTAKAKDFANQEDAVKKQIANAGDAKALADAAAKAWQDYYNCMLHCVHASASGGRTATGFSNCPEAQSWIDQANEIRDRADRERANANAMRAAGNTQQAATLDDIARQDDASAQLREKNAAYALERCASPASAGLSPDGVPTNASPNADQPAALPGNTKILPHNGTHNASITIRNQCPQGETYSIQSNGLPEGLFQNKLGLQVGSNSAQAIPIVYNTSGIPSGLYSGNVVIQCTTCGTNCPRADTTLPVNLYVSRN